MDTTFQTRYFSVRIATHPQALIVVRGELDLAGVETFQAAVRTLDLPGTRRVMLDLRGLTFMDAAGLHAVLDLHDECLNVSTALTILPGPRHVQRVFELTGADRLVPFAGLVRKERNRGSR